MRLPLQSLKTRLLVPLLATALLSAILIAIVSFWQGKRWALVEVRDRFARLERTLREASFPLSGHVVRSLAELTATELIAIDEDRRILTSSLEVSAADRRWVNQQAKADGWESGVQAASPEVAAVDQSTSWRLGSWRLAEREYLAYRIPRTGGRRAGVLRTDSDIGFGGPAGVDRTAWVIVLFDEAQVEAAGRRAAVFPLATGLSTIILLTTLTWLISSRLVHRLVRLQHGVHRVATGDFDTRVSDHAPDEIGQLGAAVDSMGEQLSQLWRQLNRQQNEKLLHQIAGGMAHQLRNTMTGSRMAIELHRDNSSCQECEELTVAIRQLEVAEAYVQRLMLVGAGRQEADRPAPLTACLDDIQSLHRALAQHLRVDVQWRWEPNDLQGEVADGPTLVAAISNLVWNAMQAATRVIVEARQPDPASCLITVRDNGPGIDPEIADELFEPFVSSKPEGLGLGLPLVRRAAERLGGHVQWQRIEAWTVFEFQCPLSNQP